jgi:hypothetical protein
LNSTFFYRRLQNCTVHNQTLSTIHVVCVQGFDGGLPQMFTMEVIDAATNFVVANTTNSQAPRCQCYKTFSFVTDNEV